MGERFTLTFQSLDTTQPVKCKAAFTDLSRLDAETLGQLKKNFAALVGDYRSTEAFARGRDGAG